MLKPKKRDEIIERIKKLEEKNNDLSIKIEALNVMVSTMSARVTTLADRAIKQDSDNDILRINHPIY